METTGGSHSSEAVEDLWSPHHIENLMFEFWADHMYDSYGPKSQEFLRALLSKRPLPESVTLSAGKHVLKQFDQVLWGNCYQLNVQTNKQRHVRLRPPYMLEPLGPHDSPVSLEDVHFAFLEGEEWLAFPHALQEDLINIARCRPLPVSFLFDINGRTYRLDGLTALMAGGGTGRATATCLRDGNKREVRLLEGAAPVLDVADIPGRHTLVHEEYMSLGTQFGTHAAVFRWLYTHTGCTSVAKHAEDIEDEETRTVLLDNFRKPQVPDEVTLPDGSVVKHFSSLELGLAGLERTKRPSLIQTMLPFLSPKVSWCMLELELPLPCPGRLQLPEALDGSAELHLEEYGRGLTLKEVGNLQNAEDKADAAQCYICFCEMEPKDAVSSSAATPGVVELKCGHTFHGNCIRAWFREKRRCPMCHLSFGKVVGSQPARGLMRWHYEQHALPGHDCNHMIVMDFEFPEGVDDKGEPYRKRRCRGYLPANSQGSILLELFKLAFRRRVMFGLGHSFATEAYRPTFNIHLKTNVKGGPTNHGYPDESYFERSMEELLANGITRADLPV